MFNAIARFFKRLFGSKSEKPDLTVVPPAPPVEAKEPVERPSNLESTCPAPGIFQAVDLSQYCTQRFLDTMRYLGVKTIIRYYDWPGSPTLPQKIPTQKELELIKRNGFKFLGIFQHSNNRISSFTPERGIKDAGVALELAKKWGQPKGSAIYFGVDFDPSAAEVEGPVRSYAQNFSSLVRAEGFRVGAYGSGLTLRVLLRANLIDLAWLSMSTGFRESKTFTRWNLKQVKDRNCGGINCDFDYVQGDIGDWWLP